MITRLQIEKAREHLDTVIRKSRVHLYKPIQIAEILRQHRFESLDDLTDLESYRTKSRQWRDDVSIVLLGSRSTSSARFQDDLFNENAVPPSAIAVLGELNSLTEGGVEAYIYSKLAERHQGMSAALAYSTLLSPSDFVLSDFLAKFRNDPGLRRSVDKAFEIVIYALITAVLDTLGATVSVSLDRQRLDVLSGFQEFLRTVIGLDAGTDKPFARPARVYRAGATNAADRGIDIWANFGPVIQVKHLDLSLGLAGDIVDSVAADRIVIVCRNAESSVIESVLTQTGFSSRVQGVITEENLVELYDLALRGDGPAKLGQALIELIKSELEVEFPSTGTGGLAKFALDRSYDLTVGFPELP